jgi:hypothetical protein
VSDLDRRLRDALRASVEPASSAGVLDRVVARRDHRRRARQQWFAAAAVVAVVLVAAGAVLTTSGGDEPSTRVAAPGARAVPVVRVIDGDLLDGSVDDAGRAASVDRLRIQPDEGYVRGPLLVAGPNVAFTAYDRSGAGFSFPPSRIVRVRVPDGTVADEVELQGEIVAIAEGEGARWALTRDKEVLGPDDPRFRVKRIAPDGSVVSNAVPPAAEPRGEVVAGGGGVWVPVRDGVLRFDPVSGAHVSTITLPAAPTSGIVAAGKAVYVATGDAVYRLDPASAEPVEHARRVGPGTIVALGAGANGELLQLVVTDRGDARVAVESSGTSVALPVGLEARAVHLANGVVWIDGTIEGSPVAIVLDEQLRSVERILVLPGPDATVAMTTRTRAVLAADGEAWVVGVG